MSSSSIVRRVAALEASDNTDRACYIVTAPSGNLLIADQNPGEDLETFRRRVRDVWLSGGNPADLLPLECQVAPGAIA